MAAGDLDPADGRLRLDCGGSDLALDALVQPDGRIVLAGQGRVGAGDLMAMRLSARALARQPDGKLVLAGITAGGGASNMAVARLGANGQLDPTFSPGTSWSSRTAGSCSSAAATPPATSWSCA